MRLPHRTPWASLSELGELCAWVYADTTDRAAKTLAVQRLSAWRVVTNLPHALDSLLSLLSVMLLDEAREPPTSFLALRQSYAAAIIRLVNGLVDPLQVGAYARSIASIAAQLGLPNWLVELRHAATHEDLPSIELLRQASREALDWLFQNYFLPTLNPSTVSSRRLAEPRPLGPLLAQYKALSKIISRDTTLEAQYQAEVQGCLREIERWIAEAKISTSGPLGFADGDEDEGEALALDQFSSELLTRGALVPLSKKKRLAPKGQAIPPPELLSIWTPLLDHIMLLHPAFASALMNRAISILISSGQSQNAPPDEDDAQSEPDSDALTYQHCIANWIAWLAHSVGKGTENRHEEAFITLANALGPGSDKGKSSKAARSLLSTLSANDEHLSRICEQILVGTKQDEAIQSELQRNWGSEDMEVMNGRLASLLALPAAVSSAGVDSDLEHVAETENSQLPQGWSKAGGNWTPCPIGVYIPAM